MVNKYLLAIILLISSSFFWSGNFFAGKIAYNTDLSPFKLSFFRWTLAFIILLPFTYQEIKKNLKYYKENFLLMSLIAFLGVTIFNSFTYISLQTTLVINSALMNSVTPVFIIGFSWLIFKTKTSLLQFIGIDSEINIQTEKPEFKKWRWVSKKELIEIIVPFKKELYINVLNEFKDELV